jgi:hypothetical protein
VRNKCEHGLSPSSSAYLSLPERETQCSAAEIEASRAAAETAEAKATDIARKSARKRRLAEATDALDAQHLEWERSIRGINIISNDWGGGGGGGGGNDNSGALPLPPPLAWPAASARLRPGVAQQRGGVMRAARSDSGAAAAAAAGGARGGDGVVNGFQKELQQMLSNNMGIDNLGILGGLGGPGGGPSSGPGGGGGSFGGVDSLYGQTGRGGGPGGAVAMAGGGVAMDTLMDAGAAGALGMSTAAIEAGGLLRHYGGDLHVESS